MTHAIESLSLVDPFALNDELTLAQAGEIVHAIIASESRIGPNFAGCMFRLDVDHAIFMLGFRSYPNRRNEAI